MIKIVHENYLHYLFNCFALSFAFSQNDNSNIKNRVLTLEKQLSSINNDNEALRMTNGSLSKINRNYANKEDLYLGLSERTFDHVNNIFGWILGIIGISIPLVGINAFARLKKEIKSKNAKSRGKLSYEIRLLKQSSAVSHYNILRTQILLSMDINSLRLSNPTDVATTVDEILDSSEKLWYVFRHSLDLYKASNNEFVRFPKIRTVVIGK